MTRTVRTAVVAFVVALLGIASERVTLSQSAGGVRAEVDKIFTRWTTATPGCAISAAVRNQTVVRSAYGMADLERDVAITPETVFDAGSVAKQFTAAAVLLLARDGKLSLDDAVHNYVPELPDYGTPVTIRQMLHHTSGLRDWLALATIAGGLRGAFSQGDAHVIDILQRQRALNFAPGTRWLYSNSGYSLAAIIVSRVSGMSFADFTASRIFRPLGMRDTSWQQDLKRVVKRRALGYSERQGAFVLDMPTVATDGPGALLTTVDDLQKWNRNFARPIVGDAALVRELQTPATFADGRTHEYAMGLVVDTYRGVPEADHSGAFAGYRAYVSRYPDRHVSIAVLCNSASANPTSYGKTLAQLLLGDVARAPASSPPAPSYSLLDADADRLVGLYRRSPQAGAIRIMRRGTSLALEGGPQLEPISRTRLRRGDNGDTMEFDSERMRYTDEFGTVDIYERVEVAAPTLDQLTQFTGEYVSDEIETVFRVALENNRLVVQRHRDAMWPLTAVYADTFASPIGVIVFDRDNAGRVNALRLTQERVWNLRFTRNIANREAPAPN